MGRNRTDLAHSLSEAQMAASISIISEAASNRRNMLKQVIKDGGGFVVYVNNLRVMNLYLFSNENRYTAENSVYKSE